MTASPCRHCGGAHSIAHCPDVLAAFGPSKEYKQLAHPPSERSRRTIRISPRKPAHSKPAPPPRQRPVTVRTCARCGQPINDCQNARKYHPDCAVDVEREKNRLAARAKSANRPPRPATVRSCARCGQPVEGKSNNTKHCRACAAEARREAHRKWQRSQRAQQNAQ